MTNFFLEELRKIYGDGRVIHDPQFVGECCYGSLGDLRVKARFTKDIVANQYPYLTVSILNSTKGEIDSVRMKIGEIVSRSCRSTNPNLRNTEPHIWVDGKTPQWYACCPGSRDYTLLANATAEYLSVFELTHERVQNRQHTQKMKGAVPMRDKPRWEIIHGDSLTVLESFPPSTFDAVITDPPYASGGRTQAEKSKATAKKYSSMGGNAPPDFDGDAKDQRSWTRWAAEWLYLARRAAKPGAPVCMFIDWRQLPCASDALQWAGWIWRGIAVWDKGNSRPQKGRFRQQAEYIVWGSNGDMPVSRPVPCLPGVFKYGNPQNRIHLTEKPLQLMQDLVKITEPGGHILDPFAGSGTTVLAAVKEGYDATGIEVTDVYADLARKRLEAELNAA